MSDDETPLPEAIVRAALEEESAHKWAVAGGGRVVKMVEEGQ